MRKQECIQLVRHDPSKNKFIVNKQAVDQLAKLDKPVAIISVVGAYRTGKSFLLNQLFFSQQKTACSRPSACFAVGSTTDSMTKGLWIHATPFLSADGKFYILVMDSEGIGSVDQDVEYDGKIIMLCFLLSSVVLYNSVGTIDELAIENLSVFLELKKLIISKNESPSTSGTMGSVDSPTLLWVLRDFSLQLSDREGQTITQNQYLEAALSETTAFSSSQSADAKKKSMIRKVIKQAFSRRECLTLVRPLLDETKLQNLNQYKQQLRPQFTQKVRLIRKTIFQRLVTAPKTVSQAPMSGSLFSRLLHSFVEAINANNYPEIGTTWDRVCEVANRELHSRLLTQLEEKLAGLQLPQQPETLKKSLQQTMSQILNEFGTKAYHGSPTCEQLKKDLSAQMKKHYKYIKTKNADLSERLTVQELQIVYAKQFRQRFQACDNSSEYHILVRDFVTQLKLSESMKFVLNKLTEGFGLFMAKKQIDKDKVVQQVYRLKKEVDSSLEWKSRSQKLSQQLQETQKKCNFLAQQMCEKDRSIALLTHRLEFMTAELQRQRDSSDRKIWQLKSTNRQLELNSRKKRQQLANAVKLLKEQNQKLLEEKQGWDNNPFSCREDSIAFAPANQTVDVSVLQDKLKQCLLRFEEERKCWNQQSAEHQSKIQELTTLAEGSQAKYKEAAATIQKLKKTYVEKEHFFVKQIEQLRKNLESTKSQYSKTCATLKSNSDILKVIGNLKQTECKKCADKENLVEQHTTERLALSAQKNKEIEVLKLQINKANNRLKDRQTELEEEKLNLKMLQQQYKELQDQTRKRICSAETTRQDRQYELEEELDRLRQEKQLLVLKFQKSVQNILKAKDRERQMYEESITRLLINIQKRESQKQGLLAAESGRASEFGRSRSKLSNY